MASPAEYFRNELSQRLCTDTNFSLPNTNLLVGVLIDAMEYNLHARYRPLARVTLQNVLKLSEEIQCLGRVLQLNIQIKHRSLNALHPFTLQALYMLSIPAAALLNPCPQVVTLMTYVAVVHRLSSFIGAQAVYDLVRDFNRIIPRKLDSSIVTKAPGVGPRVAKRCEADDAFGLASQEWARELEVPPHRIFCTSPRRYRGRPVDLHADLCSSTTQLQGVYAHASRYMRSWESVRRGTPPSPQSRPLRPVPPPHSRLPTPTVHRSHPDRLRRELTILSTTALKPAFALASGTSTDSSPPENPRASSPDSYRIMIVHVGGLAPNGPGVELPEALGTMVPQILENAAPC